MTNPAQIVVENKPVRKGVKILKRAAIGVIALGLVAYLGLVVLLQTGVLPIC